MATAKWRLPTSKATRIASSRERGVTASTGSAAASIDDVPAESRAT